MEIKRKSLQCLLIGTILLDVIGCIIVVRYRHRIASEIDKIVFYCNAMSRNKDLERINALPKLIDEPGEWYCEYKVIAHGGGGIEGKTCTNSREGVELAYVNGTRLFDIDIMQTSDSIWVCRHGWKDNIEQEPNIRVGAYRIFQLDIQSERFHLPDDVPITNRSYEQFVQIKPFHKYSPISLDDFIEFMICHTDVWMICDFGNNAVSIYKDLYNSKFVHLQQNVFNRIVISFNKYEEVELLRSINPDVKLHMKRYDMSNENYYDVVQFCTNNNIHALNLSVNNIDDEGIKYIRSRGIHVFFAVVDYLSDYLYCIEQGAYGIVSNFLFENDLKLLE